MTKIYLPKHEPQYSQDFNRFFTKKYFSTKKLLNLSKAIIAQRNKSIKLRHMPYVAYIDPTNICPLRCPLCPTGLREQGRKTGMMSFQTCKKIIDQIKDYVFFIRFYNWGEPLLNKEIFRMIDYAHQNNIGTSFSTNLIPANSKIIEKITRSPLDYLIVSIDGTNQEAYEKYRKGGNFNKVINNLKYLVSLKNPNLKVEWLYVINKYNEGQMQKAEELAKNIGVDILHFSPTVDCLSATQMNDRGKEIYKEFSVDYETNCSPSKTCSWLYSRMVFNWNGTVGPCCALDDQRFDFGDINKDSIKNIWNNNKYQLARRIFKDDLQDKYPGFVCSRCLFMK